MSDKPKWQPDLNLYGIEPRDPGWVYALLTRNRIKVGKTTDPNRRLLREAKTWCPDELRVVGVKPFWNIGRIERTLHIALAEHWHYGEWHEFVDAFRIFEDEQDSRSRNSVNFIYWMNSTTNYSEAVMTKCKHRMSLAAWRRCHGDPDQL
jgi:Meiotically up-regulated gene 113